MILIHAYCLIIHVIFVGFWQKNTLSRNDFPQFRKYLFRLQRSHSNRISSVSLSQYQKLMNMPTRAAIKKIRDTNMKRGDREIPRLASLQNFSTRIAAFTWKFHKCRRDSVSKLETRNSVWNKYVRIALKMADRRGNRILLS